MTIWVDADGCPRVVKELAFRAAQRRKCTVVLVANRPIHTPQNVHITSIVVSSGADVADDWIAERVETSDLVITADIPLAARVVEKGATGLNPRGWEYTEDNVRERLSVRDFMTDLRDSGVQTGGSAPFGPKDKQRFANALDRYISRAR
ncbi:MAG: YaiI/YqxD family protein [Bradymonadia bacterium]